MIRRIKRFIKRLKPKNKPVVNFPEHKLKFGKVISIGGTCQVAYQIERMGFRNASYPFDWLFSTNPDTVIEAIENDFSEWLEYNNLKEDAFTTTECRRVFDTRYDMIHQHIFPLVKTLDEGYPKVKDTVDRRIKRFLELKNSNDNVLFVRTNIDDAQAERLSSVLLEKYGKKAYLLVIRHIKDFEIRRVREDIPNTLICEIYDENENTGQEWRGYNPHWNKIFCKKAKRVSGAQAIFDDSFFQDFYPCEKNKLSEGFRWTRDKSVIKLVRFGGSKCRLSFSAPQNIDVKLLDVYGNEIYFSNKAADFEFEFEIKHSTREITVICDKTWKPCDVVKNTDDRELGVCLKKMRFSKQ